MTELSHILNYYKHFNEKLKVNENVFVHGMKVRGVQCCFGPYMDFQCMHRNNISSFVEFGKECLLENSKWRKIFMAENDVIRTK